MIYSIQIHKDKFPTAIAFLNLSAYDEYHNLQLEDGEIPENKLYFSSENEALEALFNQSIWENMDKGFIARLQLSDTLRENDIQTEIFSYDEIIVNGLYANLMFEINDLWIEKNYPQQFDPSEKSRDTITGIYRDPYWNINNVGDLGPKAVKYANSMLNHLYSGLKLSGNGGQYPENQTDEWKDFVIDSCRLINAFHEKRLGGAHDQLQYYFGN